MRDKVKVSHTQSLTAKPADVASHKISIHRSQRWLVIKELLPSVCSYMSVYFSFH